MKNVVEDMDDLPKLNAKETKCSRLESLPLIQNAPSLSLRPPTAKSRQLLLNKMHLRADNADFNFKRSINFPIIPANATRAIFSPRWKSKEICFHRNLENLENPKNSKNFQNFSTPSGSFTGNKMIFNEENEQAIEQNHNFRKLNFERNLIKTNNEQQHDRSENENNLNETFYQHKILTERILKNISLKLSLKNLSENSVGGFLHQNFELSKSNESRLSNENLLKYGLNTFIVYSTSKNFCSWRRTLGNQAGTVFNSAFCEVLERNLKNHDHGKQLDLKKLFYDIFEKVVNDEIIFKGKFLKQVPDIWVWWGNWPKFRIPKHMSRD